MRRHIAALLAGALIVGPAPALTIDGPRITLDAAEVAACDAEGGCAVYTMRALAQLRELIRLQTLVGCKGAT
jgi:hypothetical protein